METESVTLTKAAKELMWLKSVLENESLNLWLDECLLCYDNQAAIRFSVCLIENAWTKHIDIKHHFLQNLVYNNIFELHFK